MILELLYVIIELKRYQRRNRYGQRNAWQSHQHCTKAKELITKRAWRFAERFKQGRIKMGKRRSNTEAGNAYKAVRYS